MTKLKQFISLIIVSVFFLNSMGCSTVPAYVQYDEFKSEMNLKATSFTGQNLGPVKGEEGGAIWDDCSNKAKGSLRALMANAKHKGANAVGDITWFATKSSSPGCKKSWGYLVIWPFILTPLFMSTEVSGTAYKAKPGTAGVFMIPESIAGQEALIELLVATK